MCVKSPSVHKCIYASIQCFDDNGWDLCALFTWGLKRYLQLYFIQFFVQLCFSCSLKGGSILHKTL